MHNFVPHRIEHHLGDGMKPQLVAGILVARHLKTAEDQAFNDLGIALPLSQQPAEMLTFLRDAKPITPMIQ